MTEGGWGWRIPVVRTRISFILMTRVEWVTRGSISIVSHDHLCLCWRWRYDGVVKRWKEDIYRKSRKKRMWWLAYDFGDGQTQSNMA